MTAFGAVAVFLSSWTGWNSLKVLAVDQQVSAVQIDFTKQNGDIKGDVKILNTRVDNNDKRMDRFEAKLDALLKERNIDPKPINEQYKIAVATSTP